MSGVLAPPKLLNVLEVYYFFPCANVGGGSCCAQRLLVNNRLPAPSPVGASLHVHLHPRLELCACLLLVWRHFIVPRSVVTTTTVSMENGSITRVSDWRRW